MTPPAPSHTSVNIATIGSGDIAPPTSSTLLHGVTLRPPAPAWDGNAYTGSHLTHIELAAARQVPGVVDILVKSNFIGIIASQRHQAMHAKAQVQAQWASSAGSPGDSDALSAAISPSYSWQIDQSGATPAWAIAHYAGNALTVWTSCSRIDLLQNEIALLCNIAPQAVSIIPNGQVHVNGYDIAVDAALLSRSVAKPVRVEEASTAGTIEIQIRMTAAGPGQAFTQYAAAGNRHLVRRPSLAALFCGYAGHYLCEASVPAGSYAADVQYSVAPHNAPLDARPDGAYASAQAFAYESFFDELCRTQNRDPIQARLDLVTDATGQNLIRSVAEQANWHDARKPDSQVDTGKGFAYTHIIDNAENPPRQVWSAWVAEVAIDRKSGAIDLTRLTVGHNTQDLNRPASTAAQVETSVRDAALQWLHDSNSFDQWGAVKDAPSAGYPLSLPEVQLVAQNRSVSAELAWSKHAELPAAAAIANAIYDATGIRYRQLPFDAGIVKNQLKKRQAPYRKLAYAALGSIAATAAGLVVSALPWRSAIAPVADIDTSVYSQSAIERGRLVATAGDCMVCHTAAGGQPNAGGLALDTPFGVVYTTNITPDKKTGIGAWSYAAFERAMRQGIHQDGRRLYPAFPYTAFTKITDADMQSLYAYLMTQVPVQSQAPKTQLSFPFNMRPLLAGWNLMFLRDRRFQPDPAQTTLWNRGAYLVEGAGHCAACHSPRNALGAEKSAQKDFLAGGFADGWEAPPLNSLSKSPIPWTENELYQYLRTGYSSLHGVAAGPMGPVVHGLAQLPESDVRAMAHYLGTLNPAPESAVSPAIQAARLEDQSKSNQTVMSLAGEGLFEGACAVCHDARSGPPLFGSRPSLALNSNLHSDSPDNVIQVLMHGISDPATKGLGYMPGFKDSMNDQQMQTLLEYLRSRFAPDRKAWNNLPEKIQAIRATAPH